MTIISSAISKTSCLINTTLRLPFSPFDKQASKLRELSYIKPLQGHLCLRFLFDSLWHIFSFGVLWRWVSYTHRRGIIFCVLYFSVCSPFLSFLVCLYLLSLSFSPTHSLSILGFCLPPSLFLSHWLFLLSVSLCLCLLDDFIVYCLYFRFSTYSFCWCYILTANQYIFRQINTKFPGKPEMILWDLLFASNTL